MLLRHDMYQMFGFCVSCEVHMFILYFKVLNILIKWSCFLQFLRMDSLNYLGAVVKEHLSLPR